MQVRPFHDLGRYPQFSLSASGDWSDPIVGGVGCNFFLGRKGCLPPIGDEPAWQAIDASIRDLRMGMLRVGFLPPNSGDISGDALSLSPWNDTTQAYEPDGEFFRILKRLDGLAQELDFPIMLDPWWTPRSLQVPTGDGKGRGAPADPGEYAARYVLPLVRHAVEALGCRSIRYLGLFNEPIWNDDDRSPANFAVAPGDDQLEVLTATYRAVRGSLDTAGFQKIALVGPSALCAYQYPMADFLASGVDPTPHLGALDHHYYLYHADSLKAPNESFFSTHEMVDGSVRRWCDFARRKHLPFLVTEMGSFSYGRLFWGERDMEGPASHTCAISDAQFIVRALARGAQAFLRWAFSVPAHYDGRWSLVEWGSEGVRPTPNTYPLYRELMRAIRPGCEVMPVQVGHAAGQGCSVHAVATRKDGIINLLVVNDQPGMNHDVILGPGPWSGKTLERTVVDETRKGTRLDPVVLPEDPTQGAEFVLTPYSLTVLTTQQ
jgi:hypothetical protein